MHACRTSFDDGPLFQDKKAAEEAKAKELAELFAVAIKQPKLPVGEREWGLARRVHAGAQQVCMRIESPRLVAGVDPKSVVCEFFRHNQCTKGFKCKYSHDLNVEKKGPKIDL